MSGERILVIDDDDAVRASLTAILERQGYQVESRPDATAAFDVLESADTKFDLAFLDYQMPDVNGIEALPKIKGIDPQLPVVFVTGHGGSDLAVRAIQLGAVDYVEKPFDLARVKVSAQNALEQRRLSRQVKSLKESSGDEFSEIVTRSPKMHQVFDLIERVRDVDATVLILGESGTGKELVARAIHRSSQRNKKPFVTINCAAIPAELLESELFGYEKGAFTGADQRRDGKVVQADGGSLFLDEIGDLSADLQAKVLRVLQERTVTPLGGGRERKVDVRFVAATHRDLEARVGAGRFREDLYYRLAQFPIELPPLRERTEDIVPLVEHLLSGVNAEDLDVSGITPGALEVLESYDWPGNVRELENVVWRAAILAGSGQIDLEHLPRSLLRESQLPAERHRTVPEGEAEPGLVPPWRRPEDIWPLEHLEKVAITAALEICGNNVSETAKRLEIGRATMYRKIEQYGLGEHE